jgi:hypothetical protein
LKKHYRRTTIYAAAGLTLLSCRISDAQLIDNTQASNNAKAGINKSLQEEVGGGRGDLMTPNSSVYIINRDPFRAIRRGRQIFQRKFTQLHWQGPNDSDGVGDLSRRWIGGQLRLCHGRPGRSAGSGGSVSTRPDSRDAPHLFGLGIREMLDDEITTDLRNIRASAIAATQQVHHPPPAADAEHGNEIDPALVDYLEFYLLNYFKPAHLQETATTRLGRAIFNKIGCASCHVADLMINHDRRVADVETRLRSGERSYSINCFLRRFRCSSPKTTAPACRL